MSSLARRSLHTTAAAAGIAALGVGLAGYAFAAPTASVLPGTDASPAVTDLITLDSVNGQPGFAGAGGESSNVAPDLPQLFSFDAPTLNTAAHGTPTFAQSEVAAPAAAPAPAATGESTTPEGELPPTPNTDVLDPVVDLGSGTGQLQGLEIKPDQLRENNRVGEEPGLATGDTLTSVVDRGASGEPLTQDMQVG